MCPSSTPRPADEGSDPEGTARTTNRALRDAADRLVDDHPHVAPGAVLRCFSRSVRAALLAGLPASRVVAEAEQLARVELSRRPRVPGPRRGS